MKWLYLLIGLALGALAHFAYSGAASNSAAVRTDLTIYRDAETGCEYLKPAWSFAGLTPRNDSLGVPICSDEGVSDKVEQMLDDVGNGEETPPAPGAPPAPGTPPQNPPPMPITPPGAAPPAPGAAPPSP
jgi:hypothetical protein